MLWVQQIIYSKGSRAFLQSICVYVMFKIVIIHHNKEKEWEKNGPKQTIEDCLAGA